MLEVQLHPKMDHMNCNLQPFPFTNLFGKKFNVYQFNPSYTKLFWTHILYQGGGGVIWTPYYLINTWLYKRQIFYVLEIPFKISENTRFVKNLLYGYHGNCFITWCFSLIIVKMLPKPQIRRC